MPVTVRCPHGSQEVQARRGMTRSKPMIGQGAKRHLASAGSSVHPANFTLGTAESRAAARVMLSQQSVLVVDLGTLPIPSEFLPTYEELLMDWKDEGDRYTHEQRRDNTLFRCAILKDSDQFRRIEETAVQ
jgi:hypothetical protein